MKESKNRERKDAGNLKTDIMDAANTSKEIVQGKFNDVKTGTKSAMNKVDAHMQAIKEKTQNSATEINNGLLDVAQDVKKTASHVAQTVTAPSKRD